MADEATTIADPAEEAPREGMRPEDNWEKDWTLPGDLFERGSFAQTTEPAPKTEQAAAEPAKTEAPKAEHTEEPPQAKAEAPKTEAAKEEEPKAEAEAKEAAKDAPKEAPKEEPPPEPPPVALALSDLQAMFPASAFNTREDFERVAQDLSVARRDLDQLAAFLGAYPEAAQFYQALAEAHRAGSADAAALAREVFGIGAEEPEPDKYEDPDAYIAWREQQAQRQAQRQQQQQARQAALDVEKRRSADYVRLFEEHARRKGYDEAQADALASRIDVLFRGDSRTGALRADTFEILERGLSFEALVKAEREAAHKEGYEKALKDQKQAARELASPPPVLDGSTAQPKAKTPEEVAWEARERRWEQEENVDLSWPADPRSALAR